MDRKTLTAYLIALAVMVAGIGVAVYFLYRDVSVSADRIEEASAGKEYDPAFPGAGEQTVAEVAVAAPDVAGPALEPEVEMIAGHQPATASVKIPSGPFQVKNCKTGRMNSFSQNPDRSLVLKDKGKALWITTFHDPICGRVETLDYYANGKLQFIFCAGSKMYVIDRLGRFVKTFPKDLGKEVLLGPDVYDFNGQRIYNVMVLHKDNTVQMYNMKGQKPSSWKGITSADTILDLPESINVGGKSFWVLRTASQTEIFPFYGGKAIATGHRISNTSKVKVLNSTSIQVEAQDGSKLTVKLR